MLENRENVTEDAHQCHYCTDFAYFSMIVCKNCNIHYCIWHNVHCGCTVPVVQLVYRFSTEEIKLYKTKISQAVQRDKQAGSRSNSKRSSSSNPSSQWGM